MLITGKRIRSVARHLRDAPREAEVVVAIRRTDTTPGRLAQIGFTPALLPGERVLPAILGPRSRENSEGVVEVHRDLPMETAYHQINWEWNEFHGDRQVPQSDTRDVPYERYQRTTHPPASIELELAKGEDGEEWVVASAIANTAENAATLTQTINLFLEIFGRCETVRPDRTPFARVPTTSLNWEILPTGLSPWTATRSAVSSLLDGMGERKQPVAERRLQILTEEFVPDEVAVGLAGFRGYLVFLYRAAGLSIVESLEYGNATYVFGDDWMELTRLTKAELIAGALARRRLVHRQGWDDEIRALLG